MPKGAPQPKPKKRAPVRRWSSVTIVMVTPHASRTVWVMFAGRQQAQWIADAINEVLRSSDYEADREGNVCMEKTIADVIKVWCEAPALKQIPFPEYLRASREGLRPPRRARKGEWGKPDEAKPEWNVAAPKAPVES